MFYKPEFIAYLWLLPVTFFVIIPAALATCRFLIGSLKASPSKVEEQHPVIDQHLMAEA